MSIVTKDFHAWFTVTNSKGDKQVIETSENFNNNYPFGFEVNFSDTPSPQTQTVTLYNLSKKHREFFAKKQKCTLSANWGKSQKVLCEGYISQVGVNQSDGVTDTLVLSFTEGTNYSNVEARALKVKKTKTVNKTKKVKVGKKTKNVKTRSTKTTLANKTFPAGTSYLNIIKGVAKQAGIVISKIDLAKNPSAKKGYTAHGKPLTVLKSLVKDTGSSMTYEKGKLVIINPKSTKRTWYIIDDQDLVQPPSRNDDNEGAETWEITIPLVPEITVNVGIEMKSKYLSGKYVVTSGQHTFDGDNPQTQCSLKKQ